MIAMKWKFVKIKNVLPTAAGSTFFEGGMFDLRFQCDFMKNDENRKCAPRQGGKHFFFANLIIVSRGPVNRKYTFFPLIFKIRWSKTAAADLAKPPFRGQKSDSFERKCSKSFSKIVLPMQARTTFFKKCHAKSELDRKNHERCILKLAFLMHNRCAS